MRDLLDTLQFDVVLVDETTFAAASAWGPASSPYLRLYLVREGRAKIGFAGQEFELRQGMLLRIPRDRLVRYEYERDFRVDYMRFNCYVAGEFDLFAMLSCPPLLRLSEPDSYRDHFHRLAAIYQDDGLAASVETNALMRLLLVPFLADAQKTARDDRAHTRFQPVFQHIESHLHTVIDVPGLAALLDCSPDYFSNLFSRTFGMTATQYINRRRIDRAQRLLLGSDLAVGAVAERVGFADVFYFSKVFKQYTGLPPSRYRQQLAMAIP